MKCSIAVLAALFLINVLQAQTLQDIAFHPDSLKWIVTALAHDSTEGRFTGSAGEQKARKFLIEEWKAAGLVPVFDSLSFEVPFTIQLDSDRSINTALLVGMLPGKDRVQELVFFSAHLDHVGTRHTNLYETALTPKRDDKSDTIYNGANDDASGIAAITRLPWYYNKANSHSRTLIFIAFSGEELGMKGSRYLSALVNPSNIIAVINLEMLGRNRMKSALSPFITGPTYSNLLELMNQELAAKGMVYQKKPLRFSKDPFEDQGLFFRSDNYPFALKGVVAHTIMVTSPADPYYHSVLDEPQTLDYTVISEVLKATVTGLEGIINGKNRPVKRK